MGEHANIKTMGPVTASLDKAGAAINDYMASKPAGLRTAFVALLLVAVFATLAIIAVQSAALAAAIPLIREVPYFVEYSENKGTIVAISRMNTESDRLEDVAKKLAMKYVKMSHEIIPKQDEMERRWGKECLKEATLDADTCGYIYLHSTGTRWKAFEKDTAASERNIAKFIQDKKYRVVRFGDNEPITKLSNRNAPGGGPLYQIEINFLMVDRIKDLRTGEYRDVSREAYRVFVTCGIMGDFKQDRKERFVNPYGFKVNDYLLTKRSISER